MAPAPFARTLAFCALSAVGGCGGPQKTALSDGTSAPRFLRRAPLEEVIGYYERTDSEGALEGTALLMDYAYLRAFASRQGRLLRNSRGEIRSETRRLYQQYGEAQTSFGFRVVFETDWALIEGDPMLDLRAWKFRLRDGRGRTVKPAAVEPVAPQGRTEVHAVPTWGGAVAYSRHSYQIQGAVKFARAPSREQAWIGLYAYPPGIESPLTFVWIFR